MPAGRPRLDITDEERLERLRASKRRYEDRNYETRRIAKAARMGSEEVKAQRRAAYALKRQERTTSADV